VRQVDWKYLTTGTAAALMLSAGVQLLVLGALQPWLFLVVAGAACVVAGFTFGRQAAVCYRLLSELPY
jgi:hypothetical protein